MKHDAVLDYYGRRLATCSSDRTIKIYEVEGETHRLIDTLKGYTSFIPRIVFLKLQQIASLLNLGTEMQS